MSKKTMQSEKTGYRRRIEVVFSVVKKVVGEYVVTKKFVNLAKEDVTKKSIYEQRILRGDGA